MEDPNKIAAEAFTGQKCSQLEAGEIRKDSDVYSNKGHCHRTTGVGIRVTPYTARFYFRQNSEEADGVRHERS